MKYLLLQKNKTRLISMLLILTIIGIITYDYAYYVPSCFEKSGEYPIIRLTGLLLFLTCLGISIYISEHMKNGFGVWIERLLLVSPFLIFFTYYKCFYYYVDHLEIHYLKNNHECIGNVYTIRDPLRRGSHCIEVRIGIDKKHTRVHRIDDKSELANSVYIGKPVFIRVSDDFPCVNEVLKWNPTKEEIERYKTPRKFKSYINGKIYEEED